MARQAADLQQLLDLVGLIYEAAFDPARWAVVLPTLADVVGAERGVVGFIGPTPGRSAVSLAHQIDEQTIQLWQAEFANYDPWFDQRGVTPAGTIIVGGAIVPWDDLRSTEVHKAVFHPAGIDDILTLVVANHERSHDFVSVHRSRRRGAFQRREVEVFRALAPHVQRANAIYRKLDGLALERAATADVLDRLAAGVVFLDERGRVLLQNRAARGILREQDGLSLTGTGGLRAEHGAANGRLQRLVAEVCRPDPKGASVPGGALAVPRPSRRRAYGVIIAPLAVQNLALTSPRRPTSVAFITDPEGSAEPLHTVSQQFGLTPAEVRVVEQLLRGRRAADIADHLRVTMPTVRTHLRRLIEKTDARSQADLVRILVYALAGLAGTSPSVDDRE